GGAGKAAAPAPGRRLGRPDAQLRKAVPGPALAALALPLGEVGATFVADVGGCGFLGHGFFLVRGCWWGSIILGVSRNTVHVAGCRLQVAGCKEKQEPRSLTVASPPTCNVQPVTC